MKVTQPYRFMHWLLTRPGTSSHPVRVNPNEDLQRTRDRLALVGDRSWVQERDGKVSVVNVNLFNHWPEIEVRIAPGGSNLQVSGRFREDGALSRIEIAATSDTEEVTAADLRNMSSVRALRAWEMVGREIARQVLSGENAFPEVDAKTPGEALVKLSQTASKDASKRKRGPAVEERLRLVVDAYREAIAAGDPHPRKTVAIKFGYTGEHIGRLLSQARKPRDGRPPLLGPARTGKAGEEVSSDASESDQDRDEA